MKKTVTSEQIGVALLQAKKNNPTVYIAMLMSMSAMRTSEIIGLRWCDVNFENASLLIHGTYSTRSIALPNLLKEELINLKEIVNHHESDFVLLTPTGSQLSSVWTSRAFVDIGISQFSLNDIFLTTRENERIYSVPMLINSFEPVVQKTVYYLKHNSGNEKMN